MKENGMEKNEKSEQQLLEEQLQAITGGCGDCVNDSLLSGQKLTQAGHLRAEAVNPFSNLTPEQRTTKVNLANSLHQEARELMTGIEQRQQNPNHWNIPHHLHH